MAKKQSNTLLFVALAAVGYYLYTRGAALSNLNFVPRGIGFNNGQVQATIGVQNTSSNPITLNSFSAVLSVGGSSLGNVSSFYQTIIAANAETPIVLNITPSIAGDLSAAISQLQGGGTNAAPVMLVGTANVNGIAAPISIQLS